jgi:hypothetical protein
LKGAATNSNDEDDMSNKVDVVAFILSKFEFEDANSEGMSAMGQRLQQLTAALIQLGQVLDRHCEGLIMVTQQIDSSDLQKVSALLIAPGLHPWWSD